MKEPEDCMAEAEREASALMGSGEAGDAQAASSGKAGGGGKGGEGGPECRALASCSRRICFCSCWILSGSLRAERKTESFRERLGATWAARRGRQEPAAAEGHPTLQQQPGRSCAQV